MIRRAFLAVALFGAFSSSAFAAQQTVEIVAMAHPPVKSALAPLRAWLAGQTGKLKVVELDAESAQGMKRLEAVGLRGHIPVVVLIDGKYRHVLKDGRQVDLVNFPDVEGAPPVVRGKLTTADVQVLLGKR